MGLRALTSGERRCIIISDNNYHYHRSSFVLITKRAISVFFHLLFVRIMSAIISGVVNRSLVHCRERPITSSTNNKNDENVFRKFRIALDYVLLFARLARCSSQLSYCASAILRLILHIFWPIVFRSLVHPRATPSARGGASSYVYEVTR